MSDIRIYKASFLRDLYWYIKRKITNTGPHGKYCGCKKWGSGNITLGCPIPTYKFTVHESITNKNK